MRQNATEMQTTGQLPEVRRFPFGSDETDLHHVEKLIVDKYLGIAYKHRGRTLEGLDCWGFLKLVYADLGFKLFDIENLEYEKVWGLRGNDYFRENYENDWEKVSNPDVLDGVLFVNSRGIANHAGVVFKNRKFIHCCRQGVVVSRLDDESWNKKTEGFYRLRNRKW